MDRPERDSILVFALRHEPDFTGSGCHPILVDTPPHDLFTFIYSDVFKWAHWIVICNFLVI